jgi:hypothetical protein
VPDGGRVGPGDPDLATPGPAGIGIDGAEQSPRDRTARFAWGAVVVILVGLVALIVYALTGPTASPGTVHRASTSGAVIADLHDVPAPVFDSVGVTANTALVVPTVVTRQPPLEAAGKPEVLFVGAEFCPFCGAERWPLIVALSRFGRFTKLNNMQSAQLSVFPGVQTFTFVGMSYSSRYVTFTGIELYSDSADDQGAFSPITALTSGQSALLDRYVGDTGHRAGPGSFPFVDIDNLMVTSTSGFSPAVIDGRSQSAIAGALTQPGDPAGQAIVASANFLTAGICRATHQQPTSVCASEGVRSAVRALRSG